MTGNGRNDSGPFTLEFENGAVRAWYLTETGADPVVDDAYEPTVFVAGPIDALDAVRSDLAADPKVTNAAIANRYTTLHDTKPGTDPEPVLSVSLERIGEVRTLARELKHRYESPAPDRSFDSGESSTGIGDGSRTGPEGFGPGTLRLFDVDLAPGFRYCLDRGVEPAQSAPGRPIRRFHVAIGDRALADGDVSTLQVGNGTADDGAVDRTTIDGPPAEVLRSLSDRLERMDPDVLVLSHAELVPLLSEAAIEEGLEDFKLGRLPGWTRVAGENTYASYGKVGHSPARYRVPGRAIVDESNSFLWHQSGLAGLLYMVRRSGRPLQEAAWGSIGTLLTSRQVRRARDERGVLAPWNKWEPERFKDVRTLHEADRGGFTFAPQVGLHENFHEIDFASLYPRIICEYNVSPETVDCACCGPDSGREPRDRVPGLDYHICQNDGFLPGVLEDLLNDRAEIKDRLAEGDLDECERRRLRGESGAIKWVLVSCFGYQGYRNAKFGRIECHEAINAHAREIAIAAKNRLEAGGWEIVHGIVDSLWVTAAVDDPEPLEDVITDVGERVDIALEHDGAYDWVCFVPLAESAGRKTTPRDGSGSASGATLDGGPSATAGALTRYFGKRESGEYKFRGIELRQRSTPGFVADCQREYVECLDAERDPAAVCDRLQRHVGALEREAVDPAELVLTKRVSKSLAAYTQSTHTVAALERYDALDVPRQPGQSVEYVVVDDGAARTSERVRLALELGDELETGSGPDYDVAHYTKLLVRAAESVVSPLGWDRDRIRGYLADGRPVSLSAFGT